MATNREQLKAFFETGDVPTEGQFGELIDSLSHRLDPDILSIIAQVSIDNQGVHFKNANGEVIVTADMNELAEEIAVNGDFINSLSNTFQTLESDSGWIIPSLENGFLNYNTFWFGEARYRKKNGIVYMEGLVKDCSANGVLFTLPLGFRPSNLLMLSNISYTGTYTVGRIDVKSNGEVSVVTVGDFTNLSGISFLVD